MGEMLQIPLSTPPILHRPLPLAVSLGGDDEGAASGSGEMFVVRSLG